MKFWSKKKVRVVKFEVQGRPPRKAAKSCWSDEGLCVLKLREMALKYCLKLGLDYFEGRVKLELTVYDQNITKREDAHDYHGDLDTLVAGVLDALQPAPMHPNFKMDPILEKRGELDPTKPLLIKDDSQVVTIVANKLVGKPHYLVSISEVENYVK